MFLLSSLQQVLVVAFLVASMLSIGLQITPDDLRLKASGHGLLLRTLLANFVVVPAIGILLARLLAADPATARAFVLLACTPGGISALQFTTKTKGAAAYAGVTACLLAVVAVFISPLIMVLAMPGGDIAVPPLAWAWKSAVSFLVLPLILARACGFLVIFLVVPMILGMVVKARAASVAPKLAKALGLISVVLFVTLIVMLMAPRKEAIHAIGGQAVGLLLLFIVLSMAVGWLLGGPDIGARQVLASATSMRNVALALAIAATLADASAVLPALIAFSALMVPPNMIFTIVCLVRNKREARRLASAPPSADLPSPQ